MKPLKKGGERDTERDRETEIARERSKNNPTSNFKNINSKTPENCPILQIITFDTCGQTHINLKNKNWC